MEEINFLENKNKLNSNHLFKELKGVNGKTIPYKELNYISYYIAESEFDRLYIMDIEENKLFIKHLLDTNCTLYLWGDGLVLDCNLSFYFKLYNFQVDDVKRHIEENKTISFAVYDKKEDIIKYKVDKAVNIL